MDEAAIAMWISRGRMAIGVAAVTAPGFAARMLSADGEAPGVAPMLTRLTGGRDIALGLGTLIAVDRGAPVRGWLEASAFADTVDTLATLAARKELTPRAFTTTVALAASSALVCAVLSRRLDTPPEPHPGQPEAIVTGHHE